jgi:hypothetical protein
MNALDLVIPFHPGSGHLPQVSIFQRDPHYRGPLLRRDWLCLLLTLTKVVELYTLYVLGAGALSWASGLNWFLFFTSAAILQYMELSRGYRRDFDTVGKQDILSGQLPSTRRPAGPCKILLGIPSNFRHHILWKIVWLSGIAVCSTSLVLCYVLLNNYASESVFAWIGFQILCYFVGRCSTISPRARPSIPRKKGIDGKN